LFAVTLARGPSLDLGRDHCHRAAGPPAGGGGPAGTRYDTGRPGAGPGGCGV